MFRKKYWLIIFVLFLFSCSTSQFGWKREPEPVEKEKNVFKEDFDPLSLNDDDIVILPESPTSQKVVAKRPVHEKPAVGEEKSGQEMIKGYRIQLLATRDEAQARKTKRDAIFKFQEHVYLIFEAPLYKLRVGDCQTEKEAEALRKKAREKGFRDAWIVPSKVYRRVESESP